MKWCSLHHHTTFSFMDGYGTPEQHVARAEELEMSALAATEHGNVSSHVRLEKAAVKAGIKPIFGVELYTGAVDEETRGRYKWHLTVLAENEVGYRNLLRLVSRGWKEGYHYEPTVSGEMLAEHADGLIVLSGCSGSKFACDLLGGKGVPDHDADLRAAEGTATRFRNLLGDRYYLEAQAFPELPRARAINEAAEQLSRKLGIGLVATADVHYPRATDNGMQVILHAAGRGSNTYEKQAQSWGYDIPLAPTTDDVILDRIERAGLSRAGAARAFATAAEIADRCNVVLPKAERLRFPCPDGLTSAQLFRRWLRDGWDYRRIDAKPNRREYVKRITYEMEMIEAKDFIDYFLMLSDVVRAAKDGRTPMGVIPVGPARGSAAASLACYLLRITEVDPMMFPTMVFERFIDVNREDIPDVDLDFDDERRDGIRQFMVERYGEARVGNIGNFVRYRGKNAINDVARVFRVPQHAAAVVNDLIIERSGGDSRFDASLEDTVGMFPQAAKVFEDYPDLWNAVKLEGNLRGMSVHAAGIVVANTPMTDICATYTRTSGKDKRELAVLSVDKYDAEYLGLMKVDALGLATMGMIRIALDLINMDLASLYDIPLDDPETLAAFKVGDVVGIFQFEGRATRLVNRDVSPDNFMELADINALSRPGPLFSGATAAYVDTKHGRRQRMRLHPIVDEITATSHGQVIYQEQILLAVRRVGNFPWVHAAAIRKIISLKKGEAAFNQMWDMFRDGAATHGIDEELALTIWKQLVTSGTYAFNVAHCISYSLLAFWCMWLKVHHPVEFYTAALRKANPSAGPKKDGATANGYQRLLRDAKKHGVTVFNPDPNWSDKTWELEKLDDGSTGIRAGLAQIRGIGDKLADAIIDDRAANGTYDDWQALSRVKGVGPAKLAMIKSFAESDDPFNLDLVARMLAPVRTWLREAKHEHNYPEPTHTGIEITEVKGQRRVVYIGVPEARIYKDYIEDERARSGDEVADIVARMKRPDLAKGCTVKCIDEGDEEVYLRFNRFKFPDFAAKLEALRIGRDVVLAIGKTTDGFGTGLYVERLELIDPYDDGDGVEPDDVAVVEGDPEDDWREE